MAVAVGVRRRRARGGSGRLLAAAGLAAGLAVVGTASPVRGFLEREIGLVVVLRLRGPVEPPLGVAVVAQDYASAEALGLPAKLGGWPRGLLARAIRNATAAGAGAIALDLVLDTARDPEGDADLAAALRESGRVVLFESMRQEARPVGRGRMALVRERAIPPLPAFAAAAGTTAPFPLPRDGSRVTGFWAFKPGAEGRPTLPTAAELAAALAEPGGRQGLGRRGRTGRPHGCCAAARRRLRGGRRAGGGAASGGARRARRARAAPARGP